MTAAKILRKAASVLAVMGSGFLAGLLIFFLLLFAAPAGAVLAGLGILTVGVGVRSAWSPQCTRAGTVVATLTVLSLVALGCFLFPTFLNAAFICLLGGALLAAVLLRCRRPRQPTLSRKTAVLLAIIGLAVGLLPGLRVLDEHPRVFPGLQLREPRVAPQDNAYFALQDMIARWDIRDDKDLYALAVGSPRGPERGTREWREMEERVVARWHPCLEAAGEMLARARFDPPIPTSYAEVADFSTQSVWPGYARELGHLMSVRSRLLLARGRPGRAMGTANTVGLLGGMIVRGNNGAVAHAAGIGIVRMALEETRQIALSPDVPAEILQNAGWRDHTEDDLKRGLGAVLAHEYHRTSLLIRELARLEIPDEESENQLEDRAMRLGRFLLRRAPLLKVNATLNTLGEYLTALARPTDRYHKPPDMLTVIRGEQEVAADTGHLKTTNPIGDILILMSETSYDRLVEQHFAAVARVRATHALLPLEARRRDVGSLPERLEDLVPNYTDEVPVDPFTGAPLRYEPAAAPPRVYAVGPDGKADGRDATEGDDIVVELCPAVATAAPGR